MPCLGCPCPHGACKEGSRHCPARVWWERCLGSPGRAGSAAMCQHRSGSPEAASPRGAARTDLLTAGLMTPTAGSAQGSQARVGTHHCVPQSCSLPMAQEGVFLLPALGKSLLFSQPAGSFPQRLQTPAWSLFAAATPAKPQAQSSPCPRTLPWSAERHAEEGRPASLR